MSRTGLSPADIAESFRDECGDGSVEWVYTPTQTWVLLDAADMREFVRRGMDVAVLEYDGRKAGAIVDACKRYIKAHPDKLRGVKAGMRGGKAYVWREVER